MLFCTASAQAGSPDEVISTRCRELEIPLDATHSAARLAGCGEDPSDNLLWHLDRIDQVNGELDGLYHRGRSGEGSVVYVMDTGVMAAHYELAGRVIAGFDVTGSVKIGVSNCVSPNKALQPCYSNLDELAPASHGTSVASLVAGKQVGVSPEARIVSIRVMNEAALATTRTYMQGLDAIIKHAWDPDTPPFRTAIVNISGWVLEELAADPDPSPIPFAAVERKIREMVGGVDASGRPDPNGKRFLFVVAANNTDGGCGRTGFVDRFPATLGPSIEGLITVGGMTADNGWWGGGCRGGDVEVLAPSQGIFSASISAVDHYRGLRPNLRSGTSFAAPIISGIAARMLSENPDLSPAELEARIESTPSRIRNPRPEYASGRVGFVHEAQGVMLVQAAPAVMPRTLASR